ncbi:MAG: redoxin domain-containing protein, partial [Gammaproteobacteria bacterium]|nr:redoxin domain-containing protein [Gammaproteobacteria bacterium]
RWRLLEKARPKETKPSRPSFLPRPGANTGTSLKIGDKFPVLNTVGLDGKKLVLGPDMLGDRATLIVFWSTWCEFCMMELPHEIELSKRYAELGLRVIGVNADTTPETARDAVRKYGIPWLNVFEGPKKTISTQLGISVWPTLYLLDAKGTILSSSPNLRGIGAEILPDGSTQQVNILDRTLEEILGGAAGEKQKLDEVQRKIELYERAFRMQAKVGAVFSLIGDGQHVAGSPDEKLLAVTSGNQIHFIDTTTVKVLRQIAAHEKGVSSLAFAPDGKSLASSGGDGIVRFWDVITGELVNVINIGAAGTSIGFSDDGRELGIATNDGVRYYELPRGKLLRLDKDAKRPHWPSPDNPEGNP